jgi:hypothetical protein
MQMGRPGFTPQEDSRYSFLFEAGSNPRAIALLEGLGKLKKKSNDDSNLQTCDLPACNMATQQTVAQVPHSPIALLIRSQKCIVL